MIDDRFLKFKKSEHSYSLGSSATSITTSNSSEPKVPPLKIVLSGQNGNSGTSSVVEDKKSPLGNKDDSKEVDKPASSKDTTTTSAVSASASGEMAENSNTNQSAMMSEGHDDSDSKGKDCELCSQCYQAYAFSSSKFCVI